MYSHIQLSTPVLYMYLYIDSCFYIFNNCKFAFFVFLLASYRRKMLTLNITITIILNKQKNLRYMYVKRDAILFGKGANMYVLSSEYIHIISLISSLNHLYMKWFWWIQMIVILGIYRNIKCKHVLTVMTYRVSKAWISWKFQVS